jgi:hypothetical protein
VPADVDDYKEHEKRRALATLVIQKWARGWKARKLTRLRKIPIRKGGMNRAQNAKLAAFTSHPDLGDPIDFYKFAYEKPV